LALHDLSAIGKRGRESIPANGFDFAIDGGADHARRRRRLARQLITIADFHPFCNNGVAKMTEAIVN
jgi:hypothetical protein